MKGLTKSLATLGIVASVVLSLGFNHIAAKEGQINDERVNFIYWDQNEISTYWSGVTNKISYNNYRPCVGPAYSEWSCGAFAHKDEYKEFCLGGASHHMHSLGNKDGGFDYIINYE